MIKNTGQCKHPANESQVEPDTGGIYCGVCGLQLDSSTQAGLAALQFNLPDDTYEKFYNTKQEDR